MIVCDMDGVLAIGPTGDTAANLPIYRSYATLPAEFDRIAREGIPLHVVTAKVGGEALQVLRAVGLQAAFGQVVGAENLLFPTLVRALRERKLPRALYKSEFRNRIQVQPAERVVMLEDNIWNLEEMLERGSVDFGLLVPRIAVREMQVHRWFDLDLALGIARRLVTGLDSSESLSATGLRVEARSSKASPGWLVHVPAGLPHGTAGGSLPLGALSTGAVLSPDRRNLVSALRGAGRILRKR